MLIEVVPFSDNGVFQYLVLNGKWYLMSLSFTGYLNPSLNNSSPSDSLTPPPVWSTHLPSDSSPSESSPACLTQPPRLTHTCVYLRTSIPPTLYLNLNLSLSCLNHYSSTSSTVFLILFLPHHPSLSDHPLIWSSTDLITSSSLSTILPSTSSPVYLIPYFIILLPDPSSPTSTTSPVCLINCLPQDLLHLPVPLITHFTTSLSYHLLHRLSSSSPTSSPV